VKRTTAADVAHSLWLSALDQIEATGTVEPDTLEALQSHRIQHRDIERRLASMPARAPAPPPAPSVSPSVSPSPAPAVSQRAPAPTPAGPQPFLSLAAVKDAMSDPRYSKDEAYREEVAQRLSVQHVPGLG
jgi:hypothetical protein